MGDNKKQQENPTVSSGNTSTGQESTASSSAGRNDTDNKSKLSDAARVMRTSSDPEERSKAASQMGHVGGAHSHSGDHGEPDDNNHK